MKTIGVTLISTLLKKIVRTFFRSLAKYRITHIPGKITIKKGFCIGAGAVIPPNTTIGEGAIVGAGAVVTKDVKLYTVVAGVPARVIKELLRS